MLRTVVKFVLLSEAFAIVTFAGGWSGVPVLALVLGLFTKADGKSVRWATVCAAAAWLELLLLAASRGPLGEVATRFGGVLGLPPVALLGLTLLFPALLAWSASSLGAAVRNAVFARGVRSGGRHAPATEGGRPDGTNASGEAANTTPEVAIADA
jgi:hypothetical protein